MRKNSGSSSALPSPEGKSSRSIDRENTLDVLLTEVIIDRHRYTDEIFFQGDLFSTSLVNVKPRWIIRVTRKTNEEISESDERAVNLLDIQINEVEIMEIVGQGDRGDGHFSRIGILISMVISSSVDANDTRPKGHLDFNESFVAIG